MKLDDTAVDGLNGFILVEETVNNCMSHNKDVLHKLEQGKHSFKIGFPYPCLYHSPCHSQCISLAISDPDESGSCENVLFFPICNVLKNSIGF